MQYKVKKTTVDFLIVGGGIGGLQAGIIAANRGVSTLIAEKADTRYSGCAATGNDHFVCYLPEIHGTNIEFVMREMNNTINGGDWQDRSLLQLWITRSFEIVKHWESYGVNMKPKGFYNFEGHTVPGQQSYHLKYDGSDIKKKLTAEAVRSGCDIRNHLSVSELLVRNNKVIGAIAFETTKEQPVFWVIQAKFVLLTTGLAARVYPSTNPSAFFDTACCPACAGAGHAMSYRAGAKLINMDIPSVRVGVKYFQRGGTGSWDGMITDIYGRGISPYITSPPRKMGDITPDVWQDIFMKKSHDGKGPLFMNCSGSAEDKDTDIYQFMRDGGLTTVVEYLRKYDIDIKKEMVEFTHYGMDFSHRGVEIDGHAQTSIENLYAAGYVVGNVNGDSTAAAVFGMIAAESVAEKNAQPYHSPARNHPLIEERLEFYKNIMDRGERGAQWKEVNATLQSITSDYAGYQGCSESMLLAGIHYLRQLRTLAQESLGARNSHELMRTLEVLDLIDVAEMALCTSRNRRETRSLHFRLDYPKESARLHNMYQTIQRKDGEIQLDFRKRN